MEIFWTILASQDRKRIREYIAEQNLMAAIELDERIGYSASSLAGQPYKGRNGRVEGTRELVIHPHFVLVYEVRIPLYSITDWHRSPISDSHPFDQPGT
ncbi:type II toxin-antitoxin system RelE/ParE family toxin [Escherichia albertii]|uniref:type II toxin-antitoxin system RelE/ParE family toxin n=1 Tax=Escherichia albertii TaxID=208962 RepID=UPI0020177F4B|nr:type II toxin-antitoxin system RelE/ParE family toxin [Escherichia albertii]